VDGYCCLLQTAGGVERTRSLGFCRFLNRTWLRVILQDFDSEMEKAGATKWYCGFADLRSLEIEPRRREDSLKAASFLFDSG
jgi:hypothetical protein